MKIKVTDLSYDEVMNLPAPEHVLPKKQSRFARFLLSALSSGEVKAVDFKYNKIDMDRLGKDEPALFLMNHSSFTDLMIAAKMLRKRQYHIITTNDGFIGKDKLMRFIGCIPTQKFITDMTLVKDMQYTFKELNSSILMFPEASYSFDGSATPLPESLGKFIKIMKVPVVTIHTKGAYLRDPLYNNLQKRNAKVTSTMKYLLSPEDAKSMTPAQINELLRKEFTYDHFRAQTADNVIVNESFRADGLHRPLYKCPHCLSEGSMHGKGTDITCRECNTITTLEENGLLCTHEKDSLFKYVTDWYSWERECVANELKDNTYEMVLDVDIMILADNKSMYRVGSGTLTHNSDGFTLTGCDGKLNYTQKPLSSYGLYSDYFWYEIGDMISIGDTHHQYYCFPKDQESAIVAKARLATEELYKLRKFATQ